MSVAYIGKSVTIDGHQFPSLVDFSLVVTPHYDPWHNVVVQRSAKGTLTFDSWFNVPPLVGRKYQALGKESLTAFTFEHYDTLYSWLGVFTSYPDLCLRSPDAPVDVHFAVSGPIREETVGRVSTVTPELLAMLLTQVS